MTDLSKAIGNPSQRSTALHWLQRLLLVSIVASLGTFGFSAWLGYSSVIRDAHQRAEQTAHLARAHALGALRDNGILPSPGYFSDFYERVFADDPSVGVNLYQQDGTLIARYPAESSSPIHLPADSPVMQAMHAGVVSGVTKIRSPNDQRSRLIAFHKVDPYPIYVHVGFDYSSLLADWYQDLLVHASFLLPALLCLVMVTRVAMKKARLEHEAVVHWREEMARSAAMADELRQAHKLEAVGQLTSGIAHDFNNLLHVMRLNTQLLAFKLGDSELANPLAAIGRAVDSGRKLTEHLLAFSRRQVLQPVAVDLVQALPVMCELLKESVPSKITLRTELAPGTWPIHVDRAELELALLNLTVNARDAMPQGGTITLGTRNLSGGAKELSEAGLPGKEVVAVSVSDTGHGIPPDILHRIFDPFFTTKGAGKGTGLGLSRIYGFAQQSGGKVRARNRATGGAMVTLYFPRMGATSAAGPPRIAAGAF